MLDLPKFAIKSDLKGAKNIYPLEIAKKTDLSCLKLDFDDLGIDKLKWFPIDLNKVSNVVKMMFLERLYMMH